MTREEQHRDKAKKTVTRPAAGEDGGKRIDSYIGRFPREVQEKLGTLRAAIRKLAPKAREAMACAIPTDDLNGNLVHVAAFDHHIGFYPGAVVSQFKQDLKGYKTAKGSIQFPLDEPLPMKLVEKT